jgi:hypothetical protein
MCVAALVALGGSSAFGGYLIDFESDTTGAKPNGWQSVDSSLVTFTDSVGAELDVNNYGVQGDGQSLVVSDDYDDSALIMDFSILLQSLSLDFGNDDPSWSDPGDEAVLTLFNGATLVDEIRVVMNRDDEMNQTIAFAGQLFNKAVFFYDIKNANRPGLIEIVDNIRFETGAVPEPTAIAAWSVLGLIGAGLIHRRRRSR